MSPPTAKVRCPHHGGQREFESEAVEKVASVRVLLEGGLRKAGDKIRITAQLIDAITGRHLWAERYDGMLGDIFALQDRVTEKVVAGLAVESKVEGSGLAI